MKPWTEEEKLTVPKRYQCELIYDSATEEQIKNPKLPRDAYIVHYVIDNERHIDVCRGSRKADIFDLYYDKFGKDVVRLIDFGYGKSNPKLWQYQTPDKPKKKK